MASKFPLKIPPGMFRNGTEYQGAGRWIDGNLVRWREGAMQAFGGWTHLPDSSGNQIHVGEGVRGMHIWTDNLRRPRLAFGAPTRVRTFLEGVLTDITRTDPDAVIQDDGGVFTDLTANATDEDAQDVQFLPVDPDTNDAGYIGFARPFGKIYVSRQAGVLSTDSAVWEYWNGSGWVALTVPTDDSTRGTVAGCHDIDLTAPSDWATTTVNAQGPFYYIRLRATDGTSTSGVTFSRVFVESGIAFKRKDVVAAISDDGGSFTDETADANEATADDVVLVPATPAVNDAFYVGHLNPFTEIRIKISTAASAAHTLAWEYWDGSAWVALPGVRDESQGFVDAPGDGEVEVRWDPPVKWAPTSVNGQGNYFYIRARVTSAGTGTALAAAVDIITGEVDTTVNSGNFGQGAFGAGLFGLGDPTQGPVTPPEQWSFSAFGQFLVAALPGDDTIYDWQLGAPPNGLLSPVLGAPTAEQVVVTPERFVFALAAGGDGRKVEWADQESLTDWTPSAVNQAGGFPLSTPGRILGGRPSKGETLIWTNFDLWAARFIGGAPVYQFVQVGSGCGAVSRNSMQVIDSRAVWMGVNSFFVYDGFVQAVESEVGDFVFSDLNRTQEHKIFSVHLVSTQEIVWFYPSFNAQECDSYVAYNWKEGHWSTGKLARVSGFPEGSVTSPVMVDPRGAVWFHEQGDDYLDVDQSTTLVPNAISGPIDLKDGNFVYDVVNFIPDEKTSGSVKATFLTKDYPTSAEQTRGPFTLSSLTNLRFSARQTRLKIEQVTPGWRWGTPRLEIEPAGRR